MSNFAAFAARVDRHQESFDYLQAHLRMSNKRITTMLTGYTLPIGSHQAARNWHINAFARACQQGDLAGALQTRRPNPDGTLLPESLHGAMQYQAQREALRWLKQLEAYIEDSSACSPSEVLRYIVSELQIPSSCDCEPVVLSGNCTMEELWRHTNHGAFNIMVRELVMRRSKQRQRFRCAWKAELKKDAEAPRRIIPPGSTSISVNWLHRHTRTTAQQFCWAVATSQGIFP